MTPVVGRPIDVLSVEDNLADITILKELFKTSRVTTRLQFLKDGSQVMPYLNGQSSRLPDLILLDLNLPSKDGRQVLKELKAHPQFKAIPVVVLSASVRPEDVRASYEASANCYITKPGDLSGFDHVIRGIESFWFSLVELPSQFGGGGPTAVG